MLTPLSAFQRAVSELGHRAFMRQAVNGQIMEYSWREVEQQARNMAFQLTQMGVKSGDKIVIWSQNCPQWVMADLAIMMVGAVSVPIYPHAEQTDVEFIFKQCEPKCVFVGSEAKALSGLLSQKSFSNAIVTIGLDAKVTQAQHSWRQLVTITASSQFEIHEQSLTDVMTYLYARQASGELKGAIHTCQSFAAGANHLVDALATTLNDHCLSLVSLAEPSERLLMQGQSFYAWNFLTFAESASSTINDVAEAQATVISATPKQWKQLADHICEFVGDADTLQRLLAWPFFGLLTQRRVKKSFGLKNLRIAASGAGRLGRPALNWFQKIGVTLHERFSCVETFGYAAMATPQRLKMGTAGRALPRVKLTLDAQHEIHVQSPTNMLGYVNASSFQADKTQSSSATHSIAKKTDRETNMLLATGQLGRFEAKGFLKIFGEASEQFLNRAGYAVFPSRLEARLAFHPFIADVVVVKSNAGEPEAILSLSALAKSQSRNTVAEALYEHLVSTNAALPKFMAISRLYLTSDNWTEYEHGYDANHSLSREQVLRHYAHKTTSDQANHDNQVVLWLEEESGQQAHRAA